jgi:hypothetical protein
MDRMQSTAIDEGTSVGQDHHTVAEHVPGDRLRVNRVGLRVPHSSLIVRVSCNISGTGNDEYRPVIKESYVDRIDLHRSRQRAPLSLDVGLTRR